MPLRIKKALVGLNTYDQKKKSVDKRFSRIFNFGESRGFIPQVRMKGLRDIYTNKSDQYKFQQAQNQTFLKLWVGTFNMAYKDIWKDKKNSYKTLEQFIPNGYDIYVIGVQEAINENLFQAMNKLFEVRKQDQFRIPFYEKVSGRGDGAIMGKKFTGLYNEQVQFVKAAAVPFQYKGTKVFINFQFVSFTQGGVACSLLIYGMSFLFLSCHFPANSLDKRKACYQAMFEKIKQQFELPDFELHGLFHHIIWMGDLNYRLGNLTVEELTVHMNSLKQSKLQHKLDQLNQEINKNQLFFSFKEPEMCPTFFPTYKKREERKFCTIIDKNWLNETYRLLYNQPWYKKLKTFKKFKKRIPGYTDRIFYYQSLYYVDMDIVTPEQIDTSCFEHIKQLQIKKNKTYHNYSDYCEQLNFSDHSPVFCTFTIKVPQYYDYIEEILKHKPIYKNQTDLVPVLTIQKIKVQHQQRQPQLPKHVTLMFPIPHESDNYEIITTSEYFKNKLRRIYRGNRPINTMQFSIKVTTVDGKSYKGYYLLNNPEIYQKHPKKVWIQVIDDGLPHIKNQYFQIELNINIKLIKDPLKQAENKDQFILKDHIIEGYSVNDFFTSVMCNYVQYDQKFMNIKSQEQCRKNIKKQKLLMNYILQPYNASSYKQGENIVRQYYIKFDIQQVKQKQNHSENDDEDLIQVQNYELVNEIEIEDEEIEIPYHSTSEEDEDLLEEVEQEEKQIFMESLIKKEIDETIPKRNTQLLVQNTKKIIKAKASIPRNLIKKKKEDNLYPPIQDEVQQFKIDDSSLKKLFKELKSIQKEIKQSKSVPEEEKTD